MAQQLQAHDEQVALVALIDSSVTAPDQATPIDQLAILGDFAHDLGLPLAAPANRDEALRSSLDQQLHYILEQAQQADIIPAGAAVRDIRQLFETYAANVRALAQYVAAPYHGHLTLLVATQEADEAVDDVAPAWSAVAAEGITIHTIVADHYSILRRPGVAELAERLRLDIAQLLEPASRV
jgi:thioesterase domain-containing protein